ncbi:hypothetical protein ACQP25_33605 [Microtetraspora malaysiensis]|uniref:hypothetical protein n=1 Tax=Microtetraspora malaysiensis TaxID=161358 RepID=UPI003D8EB3AD
MKKIKVILGVAALIASGLVVISRLVAGPDVYKGASIWSSLHEVGILLGMGTCLAVAVFYIFWGGHKK